MSAGLVIITPLRMEAFFARRGAPGVRVIRTGMGKGRSIAASRRLESAGVLAPASAEHGGTGAPGGAPPVVRAPVAVLGLGGGLVRGQRPGDIVVATDLSVCGTTAITTPRVVLPLAEQVAGSLSGAGLGVATGRIVSVPKLSLSGASRNDLAAESAGAVAVDMESWWLATGGVSGGDVVSSQLVVVRVLSDAPGAELASFRAAAHLPRVLGLLGRCASALQRSLSPTEVHS